MSSNRDHAQPLLQSMLTFDAVGRKKQSSWTLHKCADLSGAEVDGHIAKLC